MQHNLITLANKARWSSWRKCLGKYGSRWIGILIKPGTHICTDRRQQIIASKFWHCPLYNCKTKWMGVNAINMVKYLGIYLQLSLRFCVECNKIFKCTINKLCVRSPKKFGFAFILSECHFFCLIFWVLLKLIFRARALRLMAVSNGQIFSIKNVSRIQPTMWYPLCRFNCSPDQVGLNFPDRCKLLHNREHFQIGISYRIPARNVKNILGLNSLVLPFLAFWHFIVVHQSACFG